ncbi:uncharacterized protein FIBRA_01593 [Fibroporia radiculosa]|uniref:GDP/GTP exchange factor Sec2 N-terminal domain-containing protein n=1 Tax=Fibroporia radiculosa TaxID=599839 RepID=J4GKQ5_9APHY|nr:uncharacterized protein FIBRA_01593 [Fibroporia radiculosa]CCL99575.1 predicted protein [Fibroporia radiculosa]
MTEVSHSRTRSVDTEMHELNFEADYLEEKAHVVPSGTNGADAKLQRHNSDPDAQAMVIASLRSQIQDLFSQVSQLNNKLVGSYDRVSDLEDELHVSSANLRQSTLRISELELERSQHLSALSTGLLVEKDHVTTELTRLMEKATEEAAQRGQAETARAQIEKDLDDLSASLFNQANSMVAEARIGKARSERKAEETERALREAEEVVGILQGQMQALQAEKEHADQEVDEMRLRMGKGKWVDRPQDPEQGRPRLLNIHPPYQEFIAFLSHLRTIRPASPQPPAMSTLLPLPFLARLITEDSDPTVRLDLAPSLNWLTRRSVISAIHSGQLTVEPMHTVTLLEELAPSTIPGHAHNIQVSCALCGTTIFSPTTTDSPTVSNFPPSPLPNRQNLNNSWSSSLLRSVQSMSAANQGAKSQSPMPSAPTEPPTQVYIFRVAATSSGLPVSLPITSQQNTAQNRPTIYPLCTTMWCLARLRTTCSMWAFVRTGIVEKIWEETPYVPPSRHSPMNSVTGVNGVEKHDGLNGITDADKKPPVPPRRTRMGIGALWGTVQRSLSSGGKELESEITQPKENEKKPEKLLPASPKRFPVPPPIHPSLSAPPATKTPTALSSVPPPLPKRNRGRDTNTKIASTPEPDEKAEPPSLSRVTSQETSGDDFATPSEEPRSLIGARSVSPTTIPLPPSSPPTPEPHPESEPNTGHPQDLPQDATAAEASFLPTALAPVANQVNDSEKSSRTASPAPPPLPRRAAARLRPVSVIIPPPAESTPTENAEIVPDQSGKQSDTVALNDSVDDTSRTTPEVTVETILPSESDPSAEPVFSTEAIPPITDSTNELAAHSLATTEAQPLAAEEDNGDAPADAMQSSEEPSENQQVDKTVPADAPHADGPPLDTAVDNPADEQLDKHEDDGNAEVPREEEMSASSPVASSINGVVDGVEGQPVKTQPEVLEAEGLVKDPLAAEADAVESSVEEDSRIYVGDTMWEERTWKELMRLREEMYWARVGGVR